MSSITKAQANTDANTAKTTIMSTADQNFINAADLQILQAVALGKFQILCISYDRIDMKAIIAYYQGLGYKIYNPEAYLNQAQPAELFGFFWDDFWNSVYPFSFRKKPIRLIINWKS